MTEVGDGGETPGEHVPGPPPADPPAPADDRARLLGGEPGEPATPPSAPAVPPDAPPPPPPVAQAPEPPPPPPPPAAPWWEGPWPQRHAADAILLTAALSLVGGVLGLLAARQAGFGKIALCCGATTLVLAAVAVALRRVRGLEQVRGTLAVVAGVFATACFLFADDLSDPSSHDNLVKAAIALGILTVAEALAALTMPSAVAAFLSVLSLAVALSLAVHLSLSAPTLYELVVTQACLGLAAVLLALRVRPFPLRVAALRPHPALRRPFVAVVAVLLVGPQLGAMASTDDGFAIAAAACGGLALLILAQRLLSGWTAVGAFLVVSTLEVVLLVRAVKPTKGGTVEDAATAGTVSLIVIGCALLLLTAAGCLLAMRRTAPLLPRALPVEEALLAAAFALALISLATEPGDGASIPVLPFTPAGSISGSGGGSGGPVPQPAGPQPLFTLPPDLSTPLPPTLVPGATQPLPGEVNPSPAP